MLKRLLVYSAILALTAFGVHAQTGVPFTTGSGTYLQMWGSGTSGAPYATSHVIVDPTTPTTAAHVTSNGLVVDLSHWFGTSGSPATPVVTVQGPSSGGIAVPASITSSVLPTGAATSANQSTEITSLSTIATNTAASIPAGSNTIGTVNLGTLGGGATAANQAATMGVITPATSPVDMSVMGAVYNSTAPGPTNGQSLAMQTDAKGNLRAGNAMNTPVAGTAHAITTGGTAVTMVTGPVNGCQIVNPLSATDEAITTAEVAYVNPVTTATTTGNGTNVTLQPGQAWNCPGGITTNVSVNAATSSHALTVVAW